MRASPRHSRWIALWLAAIAAPLDGCMDVLVGEVHAPRDAQAERAPDTRRPDVCPPLKCNNWCNGTPKVAGGCVVGFTCQDGSDPCVKRPCATDAECAADERCVAGFCSHCGPEICNGFDDDCNGAVDEGTLCPAGQSCWQGACQADVPCTTQSSCPAGQTCVQGFCRP